MKSTFRLSGDRQVEVNNADPTQRWAEVRIIEGADFGVPDAPKPRELSMLLKKNEARAIASALMGAAAEAVS